jgi:hypothetical protein
VSRCVHVSLSNEDFLFITTYDPDRERSASRRDIAAVIEEIQAIVAGGIGTCPQCEEVP